MEQYDLEQGQGFEQVDADAVCEQCGMVNDEGTLLCKSCGNNLRDQRNLRIAQTGGPDLISDGQSKFQLLTGLLVVFGILIIFYAVWNIDKFEQFVAGTIAADSAADIGDFWTGSDAFIYDEMYQDLIDHPTPTPIRKSTLDNPQAERSYNGRYLLIRPGQLVTNRVIGEANLKRLGDRVLFVYVSNRGNTEVRGYGEFESSEDSDIINVTARETAEVRIDGIPYVGMGVSSPLIVGGHTCFALRDGLGEPYEALAYRVHNN